MGTKNETIPRISTISPASASAFISPPDQSSASKIKEAGRCSPDEMLFIQKRLAAKRAKVRTLRHQLASTITVFYRRDLVPLSQRSPSRTPLDCAARFPSGL